MPPVSSMCWTLLAISDTLTNMRALSVVRLSAARDESTSPERQREHCHNLIVQRGWSEAGVAEDLAVSATKYSPFRRPDLGDWLNNRHHEFDVLVVWRLDRLVRSSADLAELLTWCEKNDKGFVSATEGFDLSTPFGKAMVAIIAALGQLEADTVRLRVTDAHRALRMTDRWASGRPPYGYRVVDHPAGNGKALEIDPEANESLHGMAQKLITGWSFTRIAEHYKIPDVQTVITILTGLSTQGVKMHYGKPLFGPDGDYIYMAPPTFDHDTWQQLQQAAATRKAAPRTRTNSKNPMLGVGKCRCGASLAQKITRHKDVVYRDYRCGRTPKYCRGVSMKATEAEGLLEQEFLEQRGADFVEQRVWQEGSDSSAELSRVESALSLLRAEADAGLVDDQTEYIGRLKSLTTRKRDLEAVDHIPAGWITIRLDQTYADAWRVADNEGRQQMLIDAQVRFVLNGKDDWEIQVPKPAVTPEQQAANRKEAGIE